MINPGSKLCKLSKLRIKLLKTLDKTLEQAENWMEKHQVNNQKDTNSYEPNHLLIIGQSLEDQLSTLEELEFEVDEMLKAPK